ncbi:hypothetical protein J41TS8_30610 [Bacillus sp. J41TS8]|nr:hypothetical protein J41TS8_30610 [Bacillus sp. J41TS8]
MSISIKLPDGSVREFEEEASIEDVAASISCGLEHAVAGKLNGKLVDLSTPLQDGALVEIVTRDSAEGQKIAREKSRGTGRIVALDAARGLAVIGMYLQHFALNETNGSIVSGNTTLLFVLCGGISYSIMAGRMMDRGMEPAAFRTRMLARAVFIDMIGYLLIMLNTPFGVILPAYAALFVLALVLIRRSTRVLVTTAAVLLAVSPPLMILGGSVLSEAYLLGDMAGGPMSALALAPAFVAGMAIGRFDLTKMRTALSLVSSGAIMLIVSKVLGTFVLPGLSRSFEEWLVSVQGTAGAEPDQYCNLAAQRGAAAVAQSSFDRSAQCVNFSDDAGAWGCLSGAWIGMSRAAEDFCRVKAVRGSRTCSVDDVCSTVCCHMGS